MGRYRWATARGTLHFASLPGIRDHRLSAEEGIERSDQTMAREWAYGMSCRSPHHRNRALPHWLAHYNTPRPHSGIGNGATHQPRSQPTWAGHLATELLG
jgi:transposase InsO family protein